MSINATYHFKSKADFITALKPQAADGVNPHTPFVFSDPHVELMVADVVKSIAAAITDKKLSQEVMELSKSMAKQASASLIASWEPGDELCPPWPWPRPFSHLFSEKAFDPQPEPPAQPVPAAEQIELAHILTQLSGQTISKDFNVALKRAAAKLAGITVATLVDDFEHCATVPRKPFPRRR